MAGQSLTLGAVYRTSPYHQLQSINASINPKYAPKEIMPQPLAFIDPNALSRTSYSFDIQRNALRDVEEYRRGRENLKQRVRAFAEAREAKLAGTSPSSHAESHPTPSPAQQSPPNVSLSPPLAQSPRLPSSSPVPPALPPRRENAGTPLPGTLDADRIGGGPGTPGGTPPAPSPRPIRTLLPESHPIPTLNPSQSPAPSTSPPLPPPVPRGRGPSFSPPPTGSPNMGGQSASGVPLYPRPAPPNGPAALAAFDTLPPTDPWDRVVGTQDALREVWEGMGNSGGNAMGGSGMGFNGSGVNGMSSAGGSSYEYPHTNPYPSPWRPHGGVAMPGMVPPGGNIGGPSGRGGGMQGDYGQPGQFQGYGRGY